MVGMMQFRMPVAGYRNAYAGQNALAPQSVYSPDPYVGGDYGQGMYPAQNYQQPMFGQQMFGQQMPRRRIPFRGMSMGTNAFAAEPYGLSQYAEADPRYGQYFR